MEFEDRSEQQHEEEEEEDKDEDEHMRTNYDSLSDPPRLKLGRTSSRPSEPLPPPPPATHPPRYRECLKNHAVGLGVHAVDGCGEFIAAGAEGTLDALKCAACNCHRNFHRKEIIGASSSSSSSTVAENIFFHGGHYLHHHYPQFTPYYRPPPPSYLHVAQPQLRPLALPSTSGGGQSQEDQEDVSNISDGKRGSSRKRFRTKFSEEQKEKMFEVSKKLGWKIQKHDEDLVEELCNEIGIKRHVFKVWMHNNKHTLGKKP